MRNIGDGGRILVSDSQNLIQIRNKREYSRGRRHAWVDIRVARATEEKF